MIDLLIGLANEQPRRTAFILDGGGELTFEAWERRSNSVARKLLEARIRPSERVGLLFNNAQYLDYAVAYMATLRTGATAVPLSTALSDREIAVAAATAELNVILHSVSSSPPAVDCELHGIDDAWFRLDQRSTKPPELAPDDIAEILFTSGSTGTPKAVAVSHANLSGEVVLDRMDHQRPASHLHAIPIGTNWAQFVLRSTLTARMCGIVMERFDAWRTLALIEEHRPAELLMTPPMAKLLLAAAEGSFRDLSSVERLRLSGAPAAPSTLQQLRELVPSAIISAGYSSTEAAPACTLMEYPPDPSDTVGRPPSGHEVEVIDSAGRRVAPGQVGDVRLRAIGVSSRSYVHDSPDQSSTFDNGWVRTGDLGWLDAEGFLRVLGRKTEVIDVGGSKVDGPEVEAVLLQHPAVIDAAVVGIEAEPFGQQVAAVVVLREPASEEALRRFARAQLAEFKLPTSFLFVDEIPITAAGKVSQDQLRTMFTAADAPATTLPDVETIEGQLAELWSEILDTRLVTIDEDLSDHGATSLSAFTVLARFRQHTGVVVPPSRFLILTTIRDQARAIAAFRT